MLTMMLLSCSSPLMSYVASAAVHAVHTELSALVKSCAELSQSRHRETLVRCYNLKNLIHTITISKFASKSQFVTLTIILRPFKWQYKVKFIKQFTADISTHQL